MDLHAMLNDAPPGPPQKKPSDPPFSPPAPSERATAPPSVPTNGYYATANLPRPSLPQPSPTTRGYSIDNLIESRDRSLSVSPKTIPTAPSTNRSLSSHLPNNQKMGMSHLLLATPTNASPESVSTNLINRSPLTNLSTNESPPATFVPPQKRKADSELSGVDSKRQRPVRKMGRPIWARLDRRNPRYTAEQTNRSSASQHDSCATERPNGSSVAPQHGSHTNERQNGPSASQRNGHPTEPANGPPAPWRQHPPLDDNLIKIRQRMGSVDPKYANWERSLVWYATLPSHLQAVTDFLHFHLKTCEDLSPDEGSIEIEAKIGTLEDVATGQRCRLPSLNMTVVEPAYAQKNLRFHSEMVDAEHKHMNDFLNKTVERAHTEQGRQKLHYKHLREVDSFYPLSDAGYKAIPPSVLKHNSRKNLRMRTTVDQKTGKVLARIVKIKVADLHISNPQQPYDLRISMNIECNLDRGGLDPRSLHLEPTSDEPERRKDRLSYSHLCYQVDLTRVDQPHLPPKYELELEVDAEALRGQMLLMESGETSHAFTDIVDGFLENAQWLMKQNRV